MTMNIIARKFRGILTAAICGITILQATTAQAEEFSGSLVTKKGTATYSRSTMVQFLENAGVWIYHPERYPARPKSGELVVRSDANWNLVDSDVAYGGATWDAAEVYTYQLTRKTADNVVYFPVTGMGTLPMRIMSGATMSVIYLYDYLPEFDDFILTGVVIKVSGRVNDYYSATFTSKVVLQ